MGPKLLGSESKREIGWWSELAQGRMKDEGMKEFSRRDLLREIYLAWLLYNLDLIFC
jgi:hypothetical protein